MVQPAAPPAAGPDFNDFNGALLYIEVKGLKKDVSTVNGIADAVEADIAVLDGPQAGRQERDVLIFKKVMVGQLKGHIGTALVGRLTQGQAQPGKNPPWILASPTDAELAQATAWEQQNRGPQAVAPPAAQGGYDQAAVQAGYTPQPPPQQGYAPPQPPPQQGYAPPQPPPQQGYQPGGYVPPQPGTPAY